MGRSCRLLLLSPLHLLTIFGFLAAADAFSNDSKLHISNVRIVPNRKGKYKVNGRGGGGGGEGANVAIGNVREMQWLC